MRFAFDEQQEELRRAARAFLEDWSSSEHVRRAMATEEGFDRAVWERVGRELGWTALTIPEAYGGLGLGMVELVALMEVMGERLFCGPYFSTVCLAAEALLAGGTPALKERYLPGIAAGERIATVAFTEPEGLWDAGAVRAVAEPAAGGYVLRGTKSYVTDGHVADVLLVAAREPGTSGEEGLALYAVPAGVPGLSCRRCPTLDQTRPLAEVRLDGVRVEADARLEGGWETIRRVLDRAAIALAAEQVGGAQRCLDMSVSYAKERVQFGRPIGSFQAVKHKCADMFVLVESSRSAAYYAGWAASVGDPETPVLASLARAYCSDAYFRCAAEAIQIHGGVGFTWEYDVHLYFKRARSSEQLLGSPSFHRERVARHILPRSRPARVR